MTKNYIIKNKTEYILRQHEKTCVNQESTQNINIY